MLWGAAAHALIAVALQNGWLHNSHGALKDVARRLSDILKEPQWLSEFATAERFHINFYHVGLTQKRTRSPPHPHIGGLYGETNAPGLLPVFA